ncbi:MAG: MFS transporter [Clostridiales bacterium]|jgi:fucose permease|nr:MFS transporter [Clostridiales bacterium]
MFSLLLPLVYLSFISLGLPDAMLGAAWPVMSGHVGKTVSDLGLISMISTLGAVISSLFSSRLIKNYGTGKVTLASVLLTAVMLLLYSFSRSYAMLCLLTLPLGMGGGAVDSGLNGFVARNYKASHMSWLHFMWGLGATLGPLIIGISLRGDSSWPGGYRAAAIIQGSLFLVLLLSLPLWKKAEDHDIADNGEAKHLPLKEVIKTPGLKTTMFAFAACVGFEYTASVWAASYLETQKGFDAAAAAMYSSLYFFGTMTGRGVSGFVAMKMDPRRMIRFGCLLAMAGAILLALPLPSVFALIGYFMLGLGNAPIFPSMTFLAPIRFGLSISQSAIGMQMAAAYTGSTFLPPLTGLLIRATSIQVVPYVILLLIVAAFFLTERIERRVQIGRASGATA